METLHEVRDEAKVAALMQSLEREGWQGAPLVVDGDQLITGTHRYVAARRLVWTDAEIPTVELADVFSEAGLDYLALHEEYGSPTVEEAMFASLLDELPEAIREKYGIDLR